MAHEVEARGHAPRAQARIASRAVFRHKLRFFEFPKMGAKRAFVRILVFANKSWS